MKRPIIAASLCAAMLIAAGAAAAQPTATATFISSLSLDTVDIELSQVEKPEDSLLYDDDIASRVDTVSNKGVSCWIRVAHVLAWTGADGSEQEAIVADGLDNDERWLKAEDGWYYLTEALNEGETIQFLEKAYNPERDQWDGREISVSSCVEVQAVQAQNVEPNFSNANPWGDTPIQKCLYSRQIQQEEDHA